MRQQQKEHFTKQSSTIAGQSFSVELSAKLFETVYGSLYRYKEAAATRELLCNMLDSHEMRDRLYKIMASHYTSVLSIPQARVSKFLAPKGTKPVVHLPDSLEPWLEMRDYGIGLSLEQIVGSPIPAAFDEVLIQGNVVVKDDEIPEGVPVIGEPAYLEGELVFRNPDNNEVVRGPGLYTTLFRSTKSEDDGQIGSFGLGSKSPFAVSDSFTVESRYEGKIHRFLMYLNANRIPCCDIVTKNLETRDPLPEDTEEYNGLTVRVPIKNTEYGRYADELERLGFVMEPEMLPIVENDKHFNGFGQLNRDNRINNTYVQSDKNGTHYAVMGGVSYPIDTDQLPSHLSSILSRFPTTYTFFDLGELNVPPSREDLDYGEYTRGSLENALEKLRDSVVSEAITAVESASRSGPLLVFYTKERYRNLYGSSFVSLLNERIPEDPRIMKEGLLRTPGYEPELNHDYIQTLPTYPETIKSNDKFYRVTEFTSWSRVDDSALEVGDFNNKSPWIVICDEMRANVQKCKTLATRSGKNVFMFTPDPHLVKHRNSKMGKIYHNAKEMRARIRKWCGTSKDMDYIAFADALSEYFDGIVDPNSIKFTSEMDYDRLVVEGNLGIMKMRFHQHSRNARGGYTFEGTDVPGTELMKIAETGARMVYVEMSNRDVVSEMNGTHMSPKDIDRLWSFIKSIKTYDTETSELTISSQGKKWAKENSYHPDLFLVRRKAVPFLKRNSQYFVPIQDFIQEFVEHFKDMFEVGSVSWFTGQKQNIKTTIGRMDYYRWICQNLKNDDLYQQVDKLEIKLRKSYKRVQAAVKIREDLLKGRETYYKVFKETFKEINELLDPYLLRDQADNSGSKKHQQYVHQYQTLLGKLTRILGLEEHNILLASPAGSRRSRVRNETQRKQTIRKQIELYLLAQYVAESYKPVMGNKLLGKDQFMKTLLGTISPSR